jgi:TonB family protein
LKEFNKSGTENIIMNKSAIIMDQVVVTYLEQKEGSENKPKPYVIIDGIPSDNETLANLDQTKIESVSVLKNENATIVYGEKGKNGVILVTMKKGTTNKEPETQVSTKPGFAEEKHNNKKEIFTIVEEMPAFPGGSGELNKFLAYNLRVPEEARKAGLTGTVNATFIVQTDGSINNAKITRGIGKSCDEEVIRVINMMPNWQPGKQNGKPVATQFNLPVVFSKQ